MAEFNQKRRDILTAARSLFKKNGFYKTKMEEIALNAGVGKGTLYEYFTNKQEIFDETCIDSVTLIRDAIEEISSKNIDFRDKIAQMLTLKESGIGCEQPFLDSIMSNKNIISEKVVIAMMSHITDMYEIIMKIVDQGKKEGIVIKDIPSELIACLIVGTISEFIRQKNYFEDKGNRNEVIINLLFNGFGVK